MNEEERKTPHQIQSEVHSLSHTHTHIHRHIQTHAQIHKHICVEMFCGTAEAKEAFNILNAHSISFNFWKFGLAREHCLCYAVFFFFLLWVNKVKRTIEQWIYVADNTNQ